jgi:hypothetical protein
MTDVVEITPLPTMEPTRRIPGPDGKREPMKASIYERMSKAGANLMPIFPYDDAGAIVPCGTVMFGGEDRDHGHFFHGNNSFLRDQTDPNAFVVATITQRQSEEAGQHEELVAKCKNCKQEIVRVEYAAGPPGAPDFDPTQFGRVDDKYHQFSTLAGSREFIAHRNSDEGRTCKNCGHVNDVFPEGPWGWHRLVDQTRVVNAAFHELRTKAEGVQA